MQWPDKLLKTSSFHRRGRSLIVATSCATVRTRIKIAMPLTEFVRYINAQLPFPTTASRFTTPFASEGGRVFVFYANLRLESNFSPIVDTVDSASRGHVATLTATRKTTNQKLDSEAVFKLPGDDGEFIFLDRLVRTLHTLNYLTYPERHSGGLLLLKVQPLTPADLAAAPALLLSNALHGAVPVDALAELADHLETIRPE